MSSEDYVPFNSNFFEDFQHGDLLTCTKCGSVVGYATRKLHDAFHRTLEK